MRLRTLIDNLNYVELINIDGFMSEIEGISYNSKKTQPDDVFICLTGEHVDGHEYAEEAVANGACLCIVERILNLDIPQIVVSDTTEAIAQISDLFYSSPSGNKVVSTIPETADSEFDFNEALNPNLSLKDIMADLLTEKNDEVASYDEAKTRTEIEQGQSQSRVELLESGFIRNPVIKTKQPKNTTIDKVIKKPTFEKRFLSIQNIVKDSK